MGKDWRRGRITNIEYAKAGDPPLLGIAEAAILVGMTRDSFVTRRGRDMAARRQARRAGKTESPRLLPLPDYALSGNPTWLPETIREWAIFTDRIQPDGRLPERTSVA